jgi:hypothetical protein
VIERNIAVSGWGKIPMKKLSGKIYEIAQKT